MSVCLTKTEIIAGSVDGTVRTFDIRIGRYVASFSCQKRKQCLLCSILEDLQKPFSLGGALLLDSFSDVVLIMHFFLEKFLITWGSLSTVSLFLMTVTVY